MGYKFAIISHGAYPTAYVENKNGYMIYYSADKVANVHCGFTYLGNAYWDERDNSLYLGWDYAHYCDWAGYYDDRTNEEMCAKKWTTEEIFNEVKATIKSLSEVE